MPPPKGTSLFSTRFQSVRKYTLLISAAAFASISLAIVAASQDGEPIAEARLKIVRVLDHDADKFTQGLVINDGILWEGSGKYGNSKLFKYRLGDDLQLLQSQPLAPDYFGEGITVLDGKVYQLTWKSGVCFVFDEATLKYLGYQRYRGQGWGLTHDGENLIMSDGTATLRFIDPKTFRPKRNLLVTSRGQAVRSLNELEFINGEIWANVWYSDSIMRIDPDTGKVLGTVDASQLWPAKERPSVEHVLNGIAYDAETKLIYLTGKYWPNLFVVELEK